MPVDLPPPKKPGHDVAIPVGWPSDKMLNWLAVFVGVVLCVWALNLNTMAPRPNSPSAAPASVLR